MADDWESKALEYQERIAAMTDEAVRDAYECSEDGTAWQDALAEACRVREIDI